MQNRHSNARIFANRVLANGLLLAFAIITTGPFSTLAEEFPPATSKKGLQVQMLDDAIQLGVKHATLNVNLSSLIAPDAIAGDDVYIHQHDGKSFAFRRNAINALDVKIRRLTANDILVYLILLAYESDDSTVNRILLHPRYDKKAPNRLGSFNTVTDEGQDWFAAIIHFMAKRWTPQSNSKQLPRVVGYIVGNEINSHWFWSNQGHVTLEEFAKDYHRAVRLVHETVRSVSKWPRIYVSLDHHWNIRYAAGTETQTFSGRRFLDHFAKITNSHGNFDWHVAFHPYPENLFDPSFWDDETATNHFDSPRVTFKNLQVLCDYLRRDELLAPANNPRRVILSEQGFHASKDEAGELLQAAAYCYAYKLVEQQSGIDAFILHRHVDHAAEGGLQLGLWTRKQESVATPDRPRKIYECFQSADGPDWERVFNFALPIIHRSDWNGLSRPISIPADQ